MQPLVTIVTPIFNTGLEVIETIKSIRAQSYRNIEHILIDDASNNDSAKLVEKWIKDNGYPCLFIKHSTNKGICATLNEGLSYAKGKYISFIGDDIMLPHKLEKDIAYLEDNQSKAFVHSRAIYLYQNTGEEIRTTTPVPTNDFDDFMARKMVVYAPTLTFRKLIFDDVGLFDESLLFEDFDMVARILHKHEAGFIDDYTVKYVQHSQNISLKKSENIDDTVFKILKAKWGFHKKYQYYYRMNCLFSFFVFSSINKKRALKYILPSLAMYKRKLLYVGFYKLILKWK